MAEDLPQFLTEQNIDTAFAGRRGIGPVTKAVFGSFSSTLLQTAPCNLFIASSASQHTATATATNKTGAAAQ